MINLRLIANCRVYTCSKLKKYLKKQKYKKKFDLITILDFDRNSPNKNKWQMYLKSTKAFLSNDNFLLIYNE